MSITTTSTLPAPVQQSLSLRMLSIKIPTLIHTVPADEYFMPRNGGTTLRLRRYAKLRLALTPVGNSGQLPSPQNLSAVDIDAKISFYATFVVINEQVTLQAQDRPLNMAAELLGVCLRETEDVITRDMLASTSAFINCVGGTNGDNPTQFSLADIVRSTQIMTGNDARFLVSNIEGEDRFGTGPIRESFIALSSTDLQGALQNVPGFLARAQYAEPNAALYSEWGSIQNVRFLVSSLGSKTLNASNLGATVYNSFVCGKEAFSFIQQDGYSSQFVFRSPIMNDPLAFNATAGFKTAFCPRITNDQWLLNVRSTNRLV
jgi:N4-gp56 family major capsid protein